MQSIYHLIRIWGWNENHQSGAPPGPGLKVVAHGWSSWPADTAALRTGSVGSESAWNAAYCSPGENPVGPTWDQSISVNIVSEKNDLSRALGQRVLVQITLWESKHWICNFDSFFKLVELSKPKKKVKSSIARPIFILLIANQCNAMRNEEMCCWE